jgi:hypothetical protein
MSRFHAVFFLFPLFTFFGCGEGADARDHQQEEAIESADRRAERADELWRRATNAAPPEKIAFLRRLIGTYPEFPRIVLANLTLVTYLLDPSVNKPDEAEYATIVFSERHPAEPTVSDCFKSVAHHYQLKGDLGKADLERLLPLWDSFLKRALSLSVLDSDRLVLYLYAAELCGWRGETASGVPLLKEGLKVPGGDLRMRQRMLLHLARILRDQGETRTVTDAYFEEAIALADKGAKGESKDSILAEMEGR